jgi:hypothetical protein
LRANFWAALRSVRCMNAEPRSAPNAKLSPAREKKHFASIQIGPKWVMLMSAAPMGQISIWFHLTKLGTWKCRALVLFLYIILHKPVNHADKKIERTRIVRLSSLPFPFTLPFSLSCEREWSTATDI